MTAAAYEKPLLTQAFEANIALSAYQYHAVKMTGAEKITVCTVLGERAIGILQDKPGLAENGSVMLNGISKAVLGDVVAQFAVLTTDANGHLVTKTASDQVGIAIALQAGVAGDTKAVYLTGGSDGSGELASSDLFTSHADYSAAGQYTAVIAHTDAGEVIQASNAGGRILGVLQNTPNVGEPANVAVFGRCTAKAGAGGLTAGDALATAADGTLVTAAGSAFVVGFALANIVAGNNGAVFLLPQGSAIGDLAVTAGNILVGNGTALASVAMSGDATIAAGGAVTVAADVAEANLLATRRTHTSVDFMREPATSIQAKNTMAIVTAANAQQDFFRVGGGQGNGQVSTYFELAQGVGGVGANTLLAANGLTPGAGGWLLTVDNTATDSIEITQGIVSGSALSFVVGTSPAFKMQCAFLVPTRANITHLAMGFRKLVAYETASTAAEWKTAYDDKAMIGIGDNAGALVTYTSLAGVDVGPTALAHGAAVNADVLALEVAVSAAGVVTYKLGHATPGGATFAQYQAAVTAALADLAADANAVAFTFNAATEVVPSIIIGASGAGAPDVRLMKYYAGY